ncbi:hypothetical protein [Campylobacter concisus]|uniref:hypothetical protein n=1 Tax=Campylobacter concisus TaxID=199 RepID=UPI000CD9CB7E|nr:hypothetical protein [Campylobacter concisus]QPH87335.1 hypothetical protein CVT15_00770 [Campylobacter concisus]QPI02283.1 hypothetical protein G5B95_00750 [Campylobacter concisus]
MVDGKFKFDMVGQGLFYWGILNVNGCQNINDCQFSFVYDCGSTSQTRINERVKSFKKILGHNNELDMLVISHFDKDHMNGISELLRDTKVKNIFIPYYHLDDYLLFVCFIYGYGIAANIGNIILVPSTNNMNGGIGILGDDYIELPRANDIPGKMKIPNKNVFINNKEEFDLKEIWEFKFYNVELKSKDYEGIESEIKKKLDDSSLEEFIKKPGSEKELQEIYKKYIKTHHNNSKQNQSSLCLYHGPRDDLRLLMRHRCICGLKLSRYIHDFYRFYVRKLRFCELMSNGTILTGDISLVDSASDKEKPYYESFIQCFENYLKRTGVFQIPHHGSKNTWNKQILEDFPNSIFVNSASENNHNHPDRIVLCDILNVGRNIRFSNERYGVCYKIY